uniref:DUF2442 domain-containing protein n=1 Tax=Candidatus Kentrum sp. MB TaxID=2138164 RepID=A0A450XQ71_9GAMM|nr:MAG: Protein of unknown function (DUF2442) [Candidatus Kentron sp. MB]VFK31339.1 MAG: Protein of unknown function (DUF2442) [Candidatus Kentron sp. MB]VFK75446.1 MAG: Protein of unknown function (DUF2442) [Candidatus Kentron sp. MB]
MKIPRIKTALPLDDHTLIVVFDNDDKRKYDIQPLLSKGMFEPLKNPTFFKAFRIDNGGYGITWNENIDLSEYELWNHGQAIP